MVKDVIIMGAGGHAKVVADIVLRSGDNLIGFLDDNNEKQDAVVYKDYKVIGRISDSVKYADKFFVVAVGDNKTRASIVNNNNLMWYTAIHPNSVIADTVKIGEGTVIMARAVVNPDTVIGKHCIINTACSIDHDNELGDYVHISPGAHLAGTVLVGNRSWICTGASVINNVSIVDDVIIGAGATVISDVVEAGVYIGTPAKRTKLRGEYKFIERERVEKKKWGKILIPELNNRIICEAIKDMRVDVVGTSSVDEAMVKMKGGEADAVIAGIDYPTRDVILACKKYFSLSSQYFSSCFICKRDDRLFALADGGINKNPTKEQLLTIVEDTAKTFIEYTGKTPKIAMLSYSTFGSGGKNAELEKIQYVIEAIRKKYPEYVIDGEMQFDVATNPTIAKKKAPSALIKGDANILIVPDLNTGNILYKALEQFGGFTIAGPIIQGFDKPLADLSRGSTVEDVKFTIEVIEKLVKKRKK